MSRLAGSASGGKKILLASSIVLLMAAGCNSATSEAPVTQNTPTPTSIDMISPTPTSVDMTTPSPTGVMVSPTPTPSKVSATTVLKLGSSSSLGQYLVASNGMTLYASSADSANMSNCTGSCAANWPPYTVAAGLNLGAVSGVSGKIGIIAGTMQVTYNGMPLYFWVNDAKAGDTTGQGIGGFAVVKP